MGITSIPLDASPSYKPLGVPDQLANQAVNNNPWDEPALTLTL